MPGPIPTLKPRQYIDYPHAHNVAYFDIEGIADDGKGHTFLILGDDETTAYSYEHSNMDTARPRKGFFARLRRFFGRDRIEDMDHRYYSGTTQRDRVSDADDSSATERVNEVSEKRYEITEEKLDPTWRAGSDKSPPLNSAEMPWIDVVNGRYLPSPPDPPPATHNPVDYLTWAKTADPAKRMSPTHPINSSHVSTKSPSPKKKK
jgi:hypothetical protein